MKTPNYLKALFIGTLISSLIAGPQFSLNAYAAPAKDSPDSYVDAVEKNFKEMEAEANALGCLNPDGSPKNLDVLPIGSKNATSCNQLFKEGATKAAKVVPVLNTLQNPEAIASGECSGDCAAAEPAEPESVIPITEYDPTKAVCSKSTMETNKKKDCSRDMACAGIGATINIGTAGLGGGIFNKVTEGLGVCSKESSAASSGAMKALGEGAWEAIKGMVLGMGPLVKQGVKWVGKQIETGARKAWNWFADLTPITHSLRINAAKAATSTDAEIAAAQDGKGGFSWGAFKDALVQSFTSLPGILSFALSTATGADVNLNQVLSRDLCLSCMADFSKKVEAIGSWLPGILVTVAMTILTLGAGYALLSGAKLLAKLGGPITKAVTKGLAKAGTNPAAVKASLSKGAKSLAKKSGATRVASGVVAAGVALSKEGRKKVAEILKNKFVQNLLDKKGIAANHMKQLLGTEAGKKSIQLVKGAGNTTKQVLKRSLYQGWIDDVTDPLISKMFTRGARGASSAARATRVSPSGSAADPTFRARVETQTPGASSGSARGYPDEPAVRVERQTVPTTDQLYNGLNTAGLKVEQKDGKIFVKQADCEEGCLVELAN